MRDRARQVLLDGLSAAGLDVEVVGDDRWLTMLSGEHKRTIPVQLILRDRVLEVTSLFSGVLDEGHEQVYRLLLQRNQRSGPVHFALDDEGDLILTGVVPLAALDADHLDTLLGRLLALADETFNQVLRLGFASYLDGEQRWRASVGLPPNPAGLPPDAAGLPPDAAGLPPDAAGLPPDAAGLPPDAAGLPPDAVTQPSADGP